MTRVLVGVVVGGLLTACRPPPDLNKPCYLLRGNPDGGQPIRLLEAEVQAAQGKNKDFITTGSTECEDHYCVRDTNMETTAALGDYAQGYCSRHCRPSETCQSYDSALDQPPATGDPDTRLSCRALLLDVEVLATIQLGGVTDPYFCARGTAPSLDGG